MEQNSQPENLSPEDSIKMPEPEMPEAKKSKAPLIGMISLGALAVAGVTFGIISLINANSKSAEIEELNAKVNLLQREADTQLVATVTAIEPAVSSDVFSVKDAEVRAIVTELSELLTPIAGVAPIDIVTTPITKFDGIHVLTSLEKSYGVRYDTEVIIEDLNDKTIEKLQSRGFVEDATLSAGLWHHIYRNNDNILCNVSGYEAPFEVSCGYYKWVSDDTINMLNEFVDADKEKSGESPMYLRATESLDIEDSTITPYQRVILSGYNNAELFYRTSPNAKWQYFTGAQAELYCDEYDTDDIRKAYAGEQCYDASTGTQSTVQP